MYTETYTCMHIWSWTLQKACLPCNALNTMYVESNSRPQSFLSPAASGSIASTILEKPGGQNLWRSMCRVKSPSCSREVTPLCCHQETGDSTEQQPAHAPSSNQSRSAVGWAPRSLRHCYFHWRTQQRNPHKQAAYCCSKCQVASTHFRP